MRIGIVTVYSNINYGSKLQSFALQNVLKRMGHKPENLLLNKDLFPIDKIATKPSNNFFYYVKRLAFYIVHPYKIITKCNSKEKQQDSQLKIKLALQRQAFHDFQVKYIQESKFSPSEIRERIDEGIKDYDKFICGSDQIWAPNQFHEEFFLGFINKTKDKISYATSIGLPQIPEELINKYKMLVTNIGAVSVREKQGANLLYNITGQRYPVVLDPTLLLTKREWLNFASETSERNYILSFFLGETNIRHRMWVENLAKEKKCKILTLPMRKIDFNFGDRQLFDADPQKFISLIANAKFICTDSFHGLAFAINFNKDFYCFMRFRDGEKLDQNSRIYNILDLFNLRNRIVDYQNKYKTIDDIDTFRIDWEYVNQKLDEERKFSLHFLKEAINEKTT